MCNEWYGRWNSVRWWSKLASSWSQACTRCLVPTFSNLDKHVCCESSPILMWWIKFWWRSPEHNIITLTQSRGSSYLIARPTHGSLRDTALMRNTCWEQEFDLYRLFPSNRHLRHQLSCHEHTSFATVQVTTDGIDFQDVEETMTKPFPTCCQVTTDGKTGIIWS